MRGPAATGERSSKQRKLQPADADPRRVRFASLATIVAVAVTAFAVPAEAPAAAASHRATKVTAPSSHGTVARRVPPKKHKKHK